MLCCKCCVNHNAPNRKLLQEKGIPRQFTNKASCSRSSQTEVSRPNPKSASSNKLSPFLDAYKYDTENDFQYSIINRTKPEDAINKIGVCKHCHCSLNFKTKLLAGLAFYITISCSNCDEISQTRNCEAVTLIENDASKTYYDLNLH